MEACEIFHLEIISVLSALQYSTSSESWHAFLKTPKEFSGPDSFEME